MGSTLVQVCLVLVMLGVSSTLNSQSTLTRFVRIYDVSKLAINYKLGLQYQKAMMDRTMDLQCQAVGTEYGKKLVGEVLILQHESVYTLGTGAQPTSGPFSSTDQEGNQLMFDTIEVDRAGDVTYHGPGQLVLYPILDLNCFEKDISKYLRKLEQVVILTAEAFGIAASRKVQPGYTGVWVGNSKIAAIGLKISRWVTSHGVSINVDPDMRYFQNIVPCGIKDSDKSVGTMRQFNKELTISAVKDELLKQFCGEFEVTPTGVLEGEIALQKLLMSNSAL